MDALSPDDELLVILLRNLQNAGATFGEGTAPYESVRATVQEHLQDMKARNKPTNITKAREAYKQGFQESLSAEVLQAAFSKLAIQPKADSQGSQKTPVS